MNTNDAAPLVWIVEDHDRLRDTLREVLELEEIGRIATFPSCEEALASAAPADPAVIVLDLALPGISGIEGAARFKERFPACEIVVFTVFDDREKVFAAICAGASGTSSSRIRRSGSPPRSARSSRVVRP